MGNQKAVKNSKVNNKNELSELNLVLHNLAKSTEPNDNDVIAKNNDVTTTSGHKMKRPEPPTPVASRAKRPHNDVIKHTPRSSRINTVTPLSEAIAATNSGHHSIPHDGLVVSNGAPFVRIQQDGMKPMSPEKALRGELYRSASQGGPVLQTSKASMTARRDVRTCSPTKRALGTPRRSIVDQQHRVQTTSPVKRNRVVSQAEVLVLSESVELDTLGPALGQQQKFEVVITSTPAAKKIPDEPS